MNVLTATQCEDIVLGIVQRNINRANEPIVVFKNAARSRISDLKADISQLDQDIKDRQLQKREKEKQLEEIYASAYQENKLRSNGNRAFLRGLQQGG